MKAKVVSIVGLTASGKTALGIEIAKEFNGEIISCDSRQVYRGLDIGTAKVTPEQQAIIPHHLIDIVNPPGVFSVFDFQKMAYAAIDDILSRGKLPVLVGGTGLYSRSVVEGYLFADKVTNYRIITNDSKYQVLQICLLPPKEFIEPLVVKRINERLEQGMIEETRNLIARGVSKQWLQKLGLEYYWNVEFIDGRVTLNEYKYWLTVRTMQYAKRQRTWFKKEKNTVFLTKPAAFHKDCMKLIKRFLT